MGNKQSRDQEIRALLLGLDGAGKTTIMYRVKLGDKMTIVPNIGFGCIYFMHS